MAVVLIGYENDGGWSQAHTEGAKWLSTQDPTIAVQFVEAVNPGPDAETVMRALARKGFDMIIGTTFEYMPTMDRFITGIPENLLVACLRLSEQRYQFWEPVWRDGRYEIIGGMIAGARAKADGGTKLGYVAPWPVPEVIRLGNAFIWVLK